MVGLRAFYHGPYAVLPRTDKAFTLNVQGKERIVSVDRTKRAFVEEIEAVDNSNSLSVEPETKVVRDTLRVIFHFQLL